MDAQQANYALAFIPPENQRVCDPGQCVAEDIVTRFAPFSIVWNDQIVTVDIVSCRKKEIQVYIPVVRWPKEDSKPSFAQSWPFSGLEIVRFPKEKHEIIRLWAALDNESVISRVSRHQFEFSEC